jgi:hypothetical protein
MVSVSQGVCAGNWECLGLVDVPTPTKQRQMFWQWIQRFVTTLKNVVSVWTKLAVKAPGPLRVAQPGDFSV